MTKAALRQLDIQETCPSTVQRDSELELSSAADHFITRNGVEYAGTHLIIDVFDGSYLDDREAIESALRECVDACGATLLHLHLHTFTDGGGVSGVAVLAESHISIHTWPERDYAALDVFMCGDAEPQMALPILKRAFKSANIKVQTYLRGEGA